MKLYVYEHDYKCTMVRYVAKFLCLQIDVFFLVYKDHKMFDNYLKNDTLPLLVKPCGTPVTNYMKIIEYFLETAQSSESIKISRSLASWRRKAIPIMEQISYPHFYVMYLPEFPDYKTQNEWAKDLKKRGLIVSELMHQHHDTVPEAMQLINDLKDIIRLEHQGILSMTEQALIFSMLRNFSVCADIKCDSYMQGWLHTASQITGVEHW